MNKLNISNLSFKIEVDNSLYIILSKDEFSAIKRITNTIDIKTVEIIYLDKNGITCVINGSTQHAKYIAKLGLEMYNSGKTLEFGQLHPEYMRKAEAERKLEEARKAEGR